MTAGGRGGPVICAFENTSVARHALRASAWLAHGLRAPLVVSHVFDPMGIPVPPATELAESSITYETLEQAARDRAHREVAVAAERVRSGVDVEATVLEDAPVRGLLELAATRSARVLVTGTAARVGVERLLIGSVTSELAVHAPCPVIAVPRSAGLEEPGPVLAGHDGSEHGLRAARHAAVLAAQLGRDLVLVHVAARGDEMGHSDLELAGKLGAGAPQGASTRSTEVPDLAVELVRETGNPSDVLVRVARERAAALIFVGTRGRNALSAALLGSVTADIVSVADRPVGLVSSTVADTPG